MGYPCTLRENWHSYTPTPRKESWNSKVKIGRLRWTHVENVRVEEDRKPTTTAIIMGDNADSEGNLIHLILNDLKVRILSDLENLFWRLIFLDKLSFNFSISSSLAPLFGKISSAKQVNYTRRSSTSRIIWSDFFLSTFRSLIFLP